VASERCSIYHNSNNYCLAHNHISHNSLEDIAILCKNYYIKVTILCKKEYPYTSKKNYAKILE